MILLLVKPTDTDRNTTHQYTAITYTMFLARLSRSTAQTYLHIRAITGIVEAGGRHQLVAAKPHGVNGMGVIFAVDVHLRLSWCLALIDGWACDAIICSETRPFHLLQA